MKRSESRSSSFEAGGRGGLLMTPGLRSKARATPVEAPSASDVAAATSRVPTNDCPRPILRAQRNQSKHCPTSRTWTARSGTCPRFPAGHQGPLGAGRFSCLSRLFSCFGSMWWWTAPPTASMRNACDDPLALWIRRTGSQLRPLIKIKVRLPVSFQTVGRPSDRGRRPC